MNSDSVKFSWGIFRNHAIIEMLMCLRQTDDSNLYRAYGAAVAFCLKCSSIDEQERNETLQLKENLRTRNNAAPAPECALYFASNSTAIAYYIFFCFQRAENFTLTWPNSAVKRNVFERNEAIYVEMQKRCSCGADITFEFATNCRFWRCHQRDAERTHKIRTDESK